MNEESFDSELKTYYKQIKSEIKNEHQEYIKKHPELREILNDFMSSVMLEKPEDVYKYATEFFCYFNIDKDKIKYKPLIISGPSGVGKGTVIKKIITAHPDIFELSISYTTRGPKLGETHGVDYYFVSKGEFEKEIEKDTFLEYSERQGHYYGTHKGKLNSIIENSKICILEMDVDGAEKIYKNNQDWKFIFLTASGTGVLEKRMESSGQYKKPEIEARIKDGIREIEKHKRVGFYYDVPNEEAEKAIEDIIKYVKANFKDVKL